MKSLTFTVLSLSFLILTSIECSLTAAPVAGNEDQARGAGSLHLDLNDTIEQVLARNFTIRVNRFSKEIADTELSRTRGIFDPVFSTRFSQSKDENPQPVDPFTELPDSFSIEGDFFSVGLGGVTPWGMQYDLGLESNNSRGTFNDFEDEFATFAGITLTQPVLRDFGIKTNLAEIRIARRNLDISHWDLKGIVMDIVTESIFAYNDFYFAIQNLHVAERSRDLAEKLFGDNQKRVETGSMAPLDIVVAEAELALREEQVISAEQILNVQKNRLKLLIHDSAESILKSDLSIASPDAPKEIVIDFDRDVETAIAKRPEYQKALLGIENRQTELALNHNQSLPDLDLFLRYGWRGLDSGFGGSFDRVMENKTQSYSFGAQFTYPIPNRQGKSLKIAAELRQKQFQVDTHRLRQQILVELDNAATGITQGWLRIKAAEKAKELSERSLEAEEKKLKAGTTTTFVVLRLQQDLATAEIRELRAVTDYNKALAVYDWRRGTILEKFNILIPD